MSRSRYALAALVVLIIEIAITLFVHDSFVRPHVGDALAVVLVHLTLRATTRLHATPAVTIAFAAACVVEASQWFGMVDRLGLRDYPIARILLGTGFDPRDFLAYAAGAIALLLLEAAMRRNGGR